MPGKRLNFSRPDASDQVTVYLFKNGIQADEPVSVCKGGTVYHAIIKAYPTFRTSESLVYFDDVPGKMRFYVNGKLIKRSLKVHNLHQRCSVEIIFTPLKRETTASGSENA